MVLVHYDDWCDLMLQPESNGYSMLAKHKEQFFQHKEMLSILNAADNLNIEINSYDGTILSTFEPVAEGSIEFMEVPELLSGASYIEDAPQYRALHGYTILDSIQLSFNAGDLIHIHQKHPSGWRHGELHDRCGWVPSNYLVPVVEIELSNQVPPIDGGHQVYLSLCSIIDR